jgi:DTW domain-containing protein YfiP
MSGRAVCVRCTRPSIACFCAKLRPVESRTRVCILRHPRERKVAVGTALMAHLSLPNSELHHGVEFDGHPRVRELAAAEGTALLFPGEGATAPETLAGAPPRTLIVVDGTWSQARKLIHRNPFLRALPRIGFTPRRPSNYRIRRQPSSECVSTIEALAHVLSLLEGAPGRFDPLLDAFDGMVDVQLAFRALRTSPPRTRRRRNPRPRRTDTAVAELRAAAGRLLCVYAESNGEPPELVRLSALRVATGEVFDALAAPRTAAAPDLARNLELPPERIAAGDPATAVVARFRGSLRADDVFCGWGRYAETLLAAEGIPLVPFHDVRVAVSRHVGRRPAGVEQALRLLGEPELPQPIGAGRAGRRLSALRAVLDLLLR